MMANTHVHWSMAFASLALHHLIAAPCNLDILWMDAILHHLETRKTANKNNCMLVFTGEASFQGLVDGAGFRSSTVALCPQAQHRKLVLDWGLSLGLPTENTSILPSLKRVARLHITEHILSILYIHIYMYIHMYAHRYIDTLSSWSFISAWKWQIGRASLANACFESGQTFSCACVPLWGESCPYGYMFNTDMDDD